MNADSDRKEVYKYADLTEKIIRAFYQVYNALGYGFLEKVYENALCHELKKQGFRVEQQKRVNIMYDGVLVGEYVSDFVVNNTVVIEVKAIEEISQAHHAQLLNYLRAMELEVGLILNFGPKPQVKRKVYTPELHNIKKSAFIS